MVIPAGSRDSSASASTQMSPIHPNREITDNNLSYSHEYDAKKGLLKISYQNNGREGKFTIQITKEYENNLKKIAGQNQPIPANLFAPLVKSAIKAHESLIIGIYRENKLTFKDHNLTISQPQPGIMNFFRRLLGLGGNGYRNSIVNLELQAPNIKMVIEAFPDKERIKTCLDETYLYLKNSPNGLSSPTSRKELLDLINLADKHLEGKKRPNFDSEDFQKTFKVKIQNDAVPGSRFIDENHGLTVPELLDYLDQANNGNEESLNQLIRATQDKPNSLHKYATSTLIQFAKRNPDNLKALTALQKLKNEPEVSIFLDNINTISDVSIRKLMAKASSNNLNEAYDALLLLSKFEDKPNVQEFIEKKISGLKTKADLKNSASATNALSTLAIFENKPDVQAFLGNKIKQLNEKAGSTNEKEASDALETLSQLAVCDGTYIGNLNESRQPHGQGMMITSDGKIIQGVFQNGEIAHEGKSVPHQTGDISVEWGPNLPEYTPIDIKNLKSIYKGIESAIKTNFQITIKEDPTKLLAQQLNKNLESKTNTGIVQQYLRDVIERDCTFSFVDRNLSQELSDKNQEINSEYTRYRLTDSVPPEIHQEKAGTITDCIRTITESDSKWKAPLETLCTQTINSETYALATHALNFFNATSNTSEYFKLASMPHRCVPQIIVNRNENGVIESIKIESEVYLDVSFNDEDVSAFILRNAIKANLSFTAKLDSDGNLVVTDYDQSIAYNFLGDSSTLPEAIYESFERSKTIKRDQTLNRT